MHVFIFILPLNCKLNLKTKLIFTKTYILRELSVYLRSKIVRIMEYTALLEKQILGRLKIDNPWWTEGRIPSYYQDMSPRLYLDIFYPLVKDVSIQRALILMGPRRVGKTVMLYHSIQQLIDDGVSPQNIIYVSVETPIYNNILLEQLISLAKQILSKEDSQEEFYVFFDEIQYLKDWEINLKSLVDTYHNVKFPVLLLQH